MRTLRVALFVALLCGSAAALPAVEQVRVATINVANYLMMDRLVDGVYRRDYPKPEVQKQALREMLREVDADVVALQEVGPVPFLNELRRDLEREGLVYVHDVWMEGADPERHLAVLSRIPLKNVVRHDHVTFSYFGETMPVKRGMLEIVFEAPDGDWRLFNLHLKSRYTNRSDDPQSEERRVGEARALRDIIRQRLLEDGESRLLVAGDFNDTRGSRALARFLKINRQPFLSAIPCFDSRSETWTHYYQREDVYSRVDYFLASPAMLESVRDRSGSIFDNGFAEASDHRLVWLDIALSDAE